MTKHIHHHITWVYQKQKIVLHCACGKNLGKFDEVEKANKAILHHRAEVH